METCYFYLNFEAQRGMIPLFHKIKKISSRRTRQTLKLGVFSSSGELDKCFWKQTKEEEKSY